MTNRKIEYRVIPPESDAEFAACREDVLDVSARPYDPDCPVPCMDEQPVQLPKETRTPIPATKEHGRRVDDEYERAGTADIFMWAHDAVRDSSFPPFRRSDRRSNVESAATEAGRGTTRDTKAEKDIQDGREGLDGGKAARHAAPRPLRCRADVARSVLRPLAVRVCCPCLPS